MNKAWKVVLAFTAIFLAGSVFGGLLTVRFGSHLAPKRNPAPLPPAVLRHLADRLDLTPEQKEKIRPMVDRAEEEIRPILERSNETVRFLRQQSLKETGVIMRRLQQDFSGELTSEQRKKLEKIQERQRELLRDERPGLQLLRDRLGAQRDGAPPPPPSAGAKPEPAKP